MEGRQPRASAWLDSSRRLPAREGAAAARWRRTGERRASSPASEPRVLRTPGVSTRMSRGADCDDRRMPRPPQPLPPALGDAFSCSAASALGVSAKRMRASDLETPFRGVRRRRTEDVADSGPLAEDRAVRRRVLADAASYAQVMSDDAFFCGRTAAILWGAGITPRTELDVGVIAPRRAPRRPASVGISSLRRTLCSPRSRASGFRIPRRRGPCSDGMSMCVSLSERETPSSGCRVAREASAAPISDGPRPSRSRLPQPPVAGSAPRSSPRRCR